MKKWSLEKAKRKYSKSGVGSRSNYINNFKVKVPESNSFPSPGEASSNLLKTFSRDDT